VNNQFSLNLAQMQGMVSVLKDPSLYLPPDKIQLLHSAVLAQCESTDGVNDGFLNNPQACKFDPAVLLCKDGAATACLTPRQVESVRRVYAPVTLSTGAELYPGHAPGFELGWRMLEQGAEPSPLQSDVVKYIAHENPDWDWQSFDLDRDAELVLARAHDVTAADPDLSAFKARGGKLLMYHGWNDPGPAPANTIAYYEEVLDTVASDQSDWLRLFMMPGMGHCRGDIGPDQADFLTALDQWRDQGEAPATITATRVKDGRIDMSRPLCPHPQVATWTGTGDPDVAENYGCTAP
jgi:feruloyl esterase